MFYFFVRALSLPLVMLGSGCTPEPKEQVDEFTALEQLRENPEKTTLICATTTSRVLMEQCKKINSRPHLYKKSSKGKNRHGKYSSPLGNTQESTTTCTSNIVQCRTQKAKQAKSQQERVSECVALKKNIWKYECLFETAETGLKNKSLTYAQSAELCTLAGELSHNCLQHLSIVFAEHFQSLDDGVSGAKQIERYWKAREIGQSKQMKTIYWFTFLELFLNRTNTIDNSIFHKLPKSLHPLIWATITKKIIRDTQQEIPLEERTTSLQAFYNGKRSLRFPSKFSTKRHHRLAIKSSNRQAEFPVVAYFDEQKRVLGSTTSEEIQICLIMAAQSLNKHAYLIEEALKSTSKRVAYVARQIK